MCFDLDAVRGCLSRVNAAVWGIPLIFVISFIGLRYTLGLKGIQFRRLKEGVRLLFGTGGGNGGISAFGTLSTSLAAMIGTGNIIGVATAVASGGTGAVIWMLAASLVGMAVSYAEGFLAVKYRRRKPDGGFLGGAFMYIEMGMGRRYTLLARLYALLCCFAAVLGMGTFTQVNSIASAAMELCGRWDTLHIHLAGNEISCVRLGCAVCVTCLAGCVLCGGIERISHVSERLVPIMGGLYLAATIGVIITCAERIPGAVCGMLSSAFTGSAAAGGFAGATVAHAVRMGVSRGIFSNEAGLGSASIASAAADVKHPAQQGCVSMIGTFIDTTLLCTLTGLAITVSGAVESGLDGVALTNLAYSAAFPAAPWLGRGIVSAGLMLFAFASVVGWSYYGEQCAEYLGGKIAIAPYRAVYLAAVFVGCFPDAGTVWDIADILNGLMAVPNLIALYVLYPVVKKGTDKYFSKKFR